jgi:hypothetical protein
MGQKAHKLKITELRRLCDLFGVERSGATDKDSTVDALLDFLGEPSEKYLKYSGKLKIEKMARPVDEEDDDEDDDDEMEEEEEKGTPSKKITPKKSSDKKKKMPADKDLRNWVNHYVNCHNMSKSTVKQALEIAGEFFGVDLMPKKHRVKELLAEAL